MNKITFLSFILLITTLISCSGSDVYRGKWNATDYSGNKYEITFDAKSFVVKDTLGDTKKLDYTQNSVHINNSVKTYGIKLSDGRAYKINFPNSDNEKIGLILDENGNGIYALHRDEYITFEEVYKF